MSGRDDDYVPSGSDGEPSDEPSDDDDDVVEEVPPPRRKGKERAPHHRRRRRTIDDDDEEEAWSAHASASASARKTRTIHVDEDEEVEEEDMSQGGGGCRSTGSSRRQDDFDGEEEPAYDEREDDDAAWVRENGDDAVDVVTEEPLSPRHVVWRSPDGSCVMRFNLSTIRKVAARAREWRMPPHFRSPMTPAMRQQITRKFGTRALMPVWEGMGASSGMDIGGGGSQDRTFFERLAEWEARRLSDVHNLCVASALDPFCADAPAVARPPPHPPPPLPRPVRLSCSSA